jgi:hypothetical protein
MLRRRSHCPLCVSLQHDQRTYEHEHHDGEYPQFQHGMLEERLVRSRQLGYLCGEDQSPSDYRNQRHHEEGFGNEPALTKGNLHRIQQLDDEQDEEDLIKKVHGLPAQSAGPQGQTTLLNAIISRVTATMVKGRTRPT